MTIKTPEELAEEYSNSQNCLDDQTSRRHAFLAGYQAAAPQWISVKDRLPEFEVQCFWIDVKCIALNAVAARSVDDCELWWEDYTHWMPLPEPPKDAKE
jgi:hypothetical protein